MKICIVGKYPPIEGGVSMRTYWTAHALAALGHEVHVVTNAREAVPPFRILMNDEDWARCELDYGCGRVRVHWTEPFDRSQFHLPATSPFVSKLVSLVGRAHEEAPFDVIFSYYLEPYGVVGHLAAEITGLPHVVKTAGSDAGRLWLHPQFEPLYDHVLRSATLMIATGPVAQRAIERGVDPARIQPDGAIALSELLFSPEGPQLDVAALASHAAHSDEWASTVWGSIPPNAPCIGVYGKLSPRKGSLELLSAMARLRRSGRDVGLLVMGHGMAPFEVEFRARAAELALEDRVLQIPFVPHWRVPEFLRRCFAVCCLEQDFPIAFHTPVLALEVMLCGTCLVGSAEVLRKLSATEQINDGKNCIVIPDVTDVDVLVDRLAALLDDRKATAVIGARGHELGRSLQHESEFPYRIETLLMAAAKLRGNGQFISAGWRQFVEPAVLPDEMVRPRSD